MNIFKKILKIFEAIKRYDFSFRNNKDYHYIAVTTPNSLLARFLSNCDGDKFCLSCFGNFPNEEI